MKVTISRGNIKLGKIPNISLPPVTTCRPGVPCTKECYAIKAYRMYPNVRKAWDGNLAAYQEDPVDYFSQVGKWLTRNTPKYFRWHVSGDIIDVEYWYRLLCICAGQRDTKFLIFTKYFDLYFDSIPRNLSVVLSMWPGMLVPDSTLPKAWCQDGTEDRMPLNALECLGNCTNCGFCWNLKKLDMDVVFNIH